jgi:hypothetical protein
MEELNCKDIKDFDYLRSYSIYIFKCTENHILSMLSDF